MPENPKWNESMRLSNSACDNMIRAINRQQDAMRGTKEDYNSLRFILDDLTYEQLNKVKDFLYSFQ